MKKLITAFAMVCAAVSVQAAAINWAVEGIQTTGDFDSGIGDYAAGYLVYLFDDATYSQTQMAADIAAASTGGTDWKTALGSSMANFVADSNGAGNVMGIDRPGDGAFTGYMVIFDAGTVADAKYAFVTDNYTVSDNSTHKIAFGDLDGDGFVNALGYDTKANGWTAVGAPEPTSGLLLLLGMAGLALKRKRD